MERLRHLWSRLNSYFSRHEKEFVTLNNRLSLLHTSLLQCNLLSTPVSLSRIGQLNKKSAVKSMLIMGNSWFSILRSLLVVMCILYPDNVYSEFTSILCPNIYKPMGRLASLAIYFYELVGHSVCLLDRYVYFWAESKGILYHVYQLYPDNGFVSKENGFKEEDCCSLNQILKYFDRGLRFTKYFSSPLFQLMVCIMYIISNLKEANLVFSIMSSIWLINVLISIYFDFTGAIGNYCLIVISTMVLTMKLERLRQKLNSFNNNDKWNLRDFKRIIRDINKIHEMIEEQNLVKQYLLQNTFLLMRPVDTILIFFSTIDVPLWIKGLPLITGIPLTIFISLSLYYNGRLLTISRSLLNPLYSMQLRLNFESRRNYVLCQRIRLMICLISSKYRPLAFTLPDATSLVPMTAVAFIGSTVSATLLLINNII